MHVKHSILGIISLIIGLLTDFALFCAIVIGTLIGEAYVDELDETSPIFLVTGLFILGSLFMSVFTRDRLFVSGWTLCHVSAGTRFATALDTFDIPYPNGDDTFSL